MRREILEAALELGAPALEARELTWDQFVGHHRVMHFARSARPRYRLLGGPCPVVGEHGLRLVRVELERPGSTWTHDRGVALMDGESAVCITAHGLIYTEPALRGEGYAGDLETGLYLLHPELYLERRAAIYPAEGIKVVKRAFANLAELGAVVVPK